MGAMHVAYPRRWTNVWHVSNQQTVSHRSTDLEISSRRDRQHPLALQIRH